MKNEPRSNCCLAPMEANIADEGTGCYICSKCKKACDVLNCGIEKEKLLKIPKEYLLALPLRELARRTGIKHPQTVKYYLERAGIKRPLSKPVMIPPKKISKDKLKSIFYEIVDAFNELYSKNGTLGAAREKSILSKIQKL